MRFARCKTPKKKLEFFSQATQAKPFSFLQNKTTHDPPGGRTQMGNANKPCCEKPFFFLAFHQGCMYNRHIGIISKERTEGVLNKRASSCAPLFSTLLVFPN